MASERTVKIALIAYYGEGPDGKPVSTYGTLGEEVKIHDDDVERFDGLNDQHDPAEAVVPVVSQPDPLDHGLDTDPDDQLNEPNAEGRLDEPSKRDRIEDWVAYAEQEGVAIEHDDGSAKTKKELISELTGD